MEESGVKFELYIRKMLNLNEVDVKTYSPLTLAYIGDGIYDLIVRTMIVESAGNAPTNKLHQKVSAIVKASAQARFLFAIEPLLTEEELAVYKRGRNAKSYTMAKNATVADYRIATGFEALMGYLYVTNCMDRIMELFCEALKSETKEQEEL